MIDNYNTNADKVADNYISVGQSADVMRTEPSPVSRKDVESHRAFTKHIRKVSKETAAFGG